MKPFSLASVCILALLVLCSGYHTYPVSPNPSPIDTSRVCSSDSVALAAILASNGLPDTLFRRLVSIQEERIVSLKFVDNYMGYDYLGYQRIDTLPDECGGLTALESLYIVDQNLKYLPDTIFTLPYLCFVLLKGDSIEALPPNVGRCVSLSSFLLENTRVDSLPQSFCGLSNLQILHLDRNRLSSLPGCFGELGRLELLNLSSNRLKTLPPTMTELVNIKRMGVVSYGLDVSDNQLCSLSLEVRQWVNEHADPSWRGSQECDTLS